MRGMLSPQHYGTSSLEKAPEIVRTSLAMVTMVDSLSHAAKSSVRRSSRSRMLCSSCNMLNDIGSLKVQRTTPTRA